MSGFGTPLVHNSVRVGFLRSDIGSVKIEILSPTTADLKKDLGGALAKALGQHGHRWLKVRIQFRFLSLFFYSFVSLFLLVSTEHLVFLSVECEYSRGSRRDQ